MTFTKKLFNYIAVGIIACAALASGVGVNASEGWTSTLSLPSAGASYALSVKKVSVRDVKKKVESRKAAGAMTKIEDSKPQYAAVLGSAHIDASEIRSEKASSPVVESIPAENEDVKVALDPALSQQAAAAQEAVAAVEEDESILDTVLTETQEKEQRAVRLVGESSVSSTKEASMKEAVVAAVSSALVADISLFADEEQAAALFADVQELPAEAYNDLDTYMTSRVAEVGSVVASKADDFVNIRKEPSTDSDVIGKLYSNQVGTVLEAADENGWIKIKSGSLEGYVKEEFVAKGTEAENIASEVVQKKAVVTTTTLRVRAFYSADSDVISLIGQGEELNILDEIDGWYKVHTKDGDGYISSDFADVEEYIPEAVSVEAENQLSSEYAYAAEAQRKADELRLAAEKAKKAFDESGSIEDEDAYVFALDQAQAAQREADDAVVAAEKAEAERKAKAAAEEAKRKAEEAKKKNAKKTTTTTTTSSGRTSSSGGSGGYNTGASTPAQSSAGASQGQAVVNYAKQFIGNPYVWGGTSLTNGTDCSGFTMSVYAHFGVSLPHYDAAQRKCGSAVGSLADARPGDIVCYSGHVGIYIGNGQIVHASNPATGICISSATYRQIIGIRRIFN